MNKLNGKSGVKINGIPGGGAFTRGPSHGDNLMEVSISL
jgi:hypothetical protein